GSASRCPASRPCTAPCSRPQPRTEQRISSAWVSPRRPVSHSSLAVLCEERIELALGRVIIEIVVQLIARLPRGEHLLLPAFAAQALVSQQRGLIHRAER